MAVVARKSGLPSMALVRRELLTELRRPRAFAVVLAFTLVALSVAAINWPRDIYSLRMAAFFANEFFRGIAYGLFGVVVLCLPALSANAIVAEREQETFDLVRMSLVSSTGYVIAKTVNALGLFLTILAGLTPVLGTVFFLAGVETERVFAVLLMLAVTGVSVTSVSLLCSALFRKTLPAVIGSYAGIAVFSVAPVVAVFLGLAFWNFIGRDIRSVQALLEEAFVTASPLGSFAATVEGALSDRELIKPILGQFVLSAVCLGAAVWRVHYPPPPPRVEVEKPIDDPQLLDARRKNFPYYLIDPLKKKPAVEDGRNPMLVREVRWGLMNRGSMLVRVFYVSLAVYFFGAAAMLVAEGRATDIRPWIISQIVMTLCVAPAMLANTLTKERELGNIDMLRMTLLHGREIVFGKLVSGAMTLVPVVGAALLSVLPLYAMVGLRDIDAVTTGYVTLISCAFLALSLSLLASLFASRTSTAIAYGYGLVIAAFVGVALGGNVAAEWFVLNVMGERVFDDSKAALEFAEKAGNFLSPLAAYSSGIQYNLRERDYVVDYPYWLANVLGTVLVSLAIVAFVAVYFERRRMRDE